jgi:hypothetical protein
VATAVKPVLLRRKLTTAQARLTRYGAPRSRTAGKEPDVAGKKRPKSLAQTEKKAPAKPKRPKKASRGK